MIRPEDFAANLAVSLTSALLEAGASRLGRLLRGSPEEQTLRRRYEAAFEAMLREVASGLDEAQRELLADLLHRFVTTPAVAEALLDLALAGDRQPDLSALRKAFDDLGFDPSTLPVDFDRALHYLVKALKVKEYKSIEIEKHEGKFLLLPLLLEERKERKLISCPQFIAKGYTSLFLVQIYLPLARIQAMKMIKQEFRNQKVAEHVFDIELDKGVKIRITLSSPVLAFSDPVVKQVNSYLIVARFTAIPNEDCQPGTHYVLLTIADPETHLEYKSITFPVQVVDFAFDHVSRSLLLKIASFVSGLGSLIMYVLTLLKQVDETFGLPAGTAALALTLVTSNQLRSRYQRPILVLDLERNVDKIIVKGRSRPGT